MTAADSPEGGATTSTQPTRIIDAWLNLNPPEHVQEGWATNERATLLRTFHRTAELMRSGMTVDQLVTAMDDAGVAAGLLTTHPFVSGFDDLMGACEEVAEACRTFPDRFAGTGRLDVLVGNGHLMQAVRAVERMVEEFEFRAIRVVPCVVKLPPDHRSYYPIYAKAAELGIPITINVGMPGPLRPAETQRPLALDAVCMDFPELQVVATHIGHPWHEELLSLMVRHPHLYLMTSAWAPRYYPREVVDFLKSSRGKDRVMFASDYPVLDLARAVEELPLLDLDEPTAEAFCWRNAANVFQIEIGVERARHG